jgi:hypothetical protein
LVPDEDELSDEDEVLDDEELLDDVLSPFAFVEPEEPSVPVDKMISATVILPVSLELVLLLVPLADAKRRAAWRWTAGATRAVREGVGKKILQFGCLVARQRAVLNLLLNQVVDRGIHVGWRGRRRRRRCVALQLAIDAVESRA